MRDDGEQAVPRIRRTTRSGARARARAAVPADPWLSKGVPGRRLRAAAGADPRHRGQLRYLAVDHAAPRQKAPGDRTGPARARRVGQAPRGLFGGRLRERGTRSARRPRRPAGNPCRALARRRGRDAVRLPVPGTDRTARPGRQRRQRPGGQRLPPDVDATRFAGPAPSAAPAHRSLAVGCRDRGAQCLRCRTRPGRTRPAPRGRCAPGTAPPARRSSGRCARRSTGEDR